MSKEREQGMARANDNDISFPVIMAEGYHLFPYRTQKLSLIAPKVLGWRRPGRIGRRRILILKKHFGFTEMLLFLIFKVAFRKI